MKPQFFQCKILVHRDCGKRKGETCTLCTIRSLPTDDFFIFFYKHEDNIVRGNHGNRMFSINCLFLYYFSFECNPLELITTGTDVKGHLSVRP